MSDDDNNNNSRHSFSHRPCGMHRNDIDNDINIQTPSLLELLGRGRRRRRRLTSFFGKESTSTLSILNDSMHILQEGLALVRFLEQQDDDDDDKSQPPQKKRPRTTAQ